MNQIKYKLFCFIWIGGFTFLAGAINVCAIVLFGLTITHSTGNITKAAIALGNGRILEFAINISYIAFFFIGSTLSGLIQNKKSLLKKYYVILPILFGITMFTVIKMTENNITILRIIAFMIGAQNGICLKVHGITVRTSHMTGYITDAGSCFGAVLQGNFGEIYKLQFYLTYLLIFFTGCVVSAILISQIGLRTIEVLAALYFALGINIALGFATGTAKEVLPQDYRELHIKEKSPKAINF